MDEEFLIHTEALRKSYSGFEAVRGIDLRVVPGRITGFLGPNGAGKTSTIKMLLGMVKPTSGGGTIFGKPIGDAAGSVSIRRQTAYVSEEKGLYSYMTVDQLVLFVRPFFPDWRAETEEKLMRLYELPRARKVGTLSKGMRTKLALLLAFARHPKLLILDEPSEGLDPIGIEQLRQGLLASCAEGTSVFFSSHQIDEVERVAHDVCVIDRGELVMQTSLEEVRRTYVRIDLEFPSNLLASNFADDLGGVEVIGKDIRITTDQDPDPIVRRAEVCQASGINITSPDLREIFLSTIKGRSGIALE